MIFSHTDIQHSQRSFSNDWLDFNEAGIPAGVVVDIAITTNIPGSVHISQFVADGHKVYMLLSQGSVHIAKITADTTQTPLAMDSMVPGVSAVIVLGNTAATFSFEQHPAAIDSPSAIVSAELITFYDYEYLKGALESLAKLTVRNPDAIDSVPVSGDVTLSVDPRLDAMLDKSNGILTLSLTEPQAFKDTSAAVQQTASEPNIWAINGAVASTYGEGQACPVVGADINIIYDNTPVTVTKLNNSVALLDVPGLPACDKVDVIDSYIGPVAPHEGGRWILDSIYEKTENLVTGDRDMTVLYKQTYGYAGDLGLFDPDPQYDELDSLTVEELT